MGEQAMVFAPVPRLTVTVEQFDGRAELHLHAGGQGVWEARMLRVLGVPVTLCATVGGETGGVLEDLIAGEDMTLRAVHRQNSSGWYVHHRRGDDRAEVADSPGEPLTRHELDELYGLTLVEGLRSAISVLSGPMDPGLVPAQLYQRLAADLTANGSRVVADLSGEYLAAVLAGGVHVVKLSHSEAIEGGWADGDGVEALVKAMRRLHDEGADAVVVSRAGDPALALLDEQVFTVEVPPLQVVEHRGAGDSMTAGIAAVLARGGDLQQAVRTGAAVGAVNVTRHGLGSGQADVITEIAGRVRLTALR
ncbi:MAG TPA: PfkB family carbohydrate kinase [Catenuloplanes sp.]